MSTSACCPSGASRYRASSSVHPVDPADPSECQDSAVGTDAPGACADNCASSTATGTPNVPDATADSRYRNASLSALGVVPDTMNATPGPGAPKIADAPPPVGTIATSFPTRNKVPDPP